jgi:hypothetical protein
MVPALGASLNGEKSDLKRCSRATAGAEDRSWRPLCARSRPLPPSEAAPRCESPTKPDRPRHGRMRGLRARHGLLRHAPSLRGLRTVEDGDLLQREEFIGITSAMCAIPSASSLHWHSFRTRGCHTSPSRPLRASSASSDAFANPTRRPQPALEKRGVQSSLNAEPRHAVRTPPMASSR